MKLMFASDIHGSEYYCGLMLEAYKNENAQKLILLGDLLYHGPRNDLPRNYNPKSVIAMLNSARAEILAVRGNCEAEVDQMVLDFPVMADYMIMYINGRMAFITHGHIHNTSNPPMLKDGDLLIHGHTHIPAIEQNRCGTGEYTYINPGSVSIPKSGSAHSYMLLDGNVFKIKDFDGSTVMTFSL